MPVMQMRAMTLTAVSTIPDRSLVSPGHGCDTASRWTGIPESFQIARWRSHHRGAVAPSGHPVIRCEFTGDILALLILPKGEGGGRQRLR